jgi:serine/threonine-protein kinase
MMMHAKDPIPPIALDGFPPDVPPELEALVRCLMAKQPQDRPGSAMEVARRLEDLHLAPSGPTVCEDHHEALREEIVDSGEGLPARPRTLVDGPEQSPAGTGDTAPVPVLPSTLPVVATPIHVGADAGSKTLERRPSRSRRYVAVAFLAVAGMLLGGGLAWMLSQGHDSSGASSPDRELETPVRSEATVQTVTDPRKPEQPGPLAEETNRNAAENAKTATSPAGAAPANPVVPDSVRDKKKAPPKIKRGVERKLPGCASLRCPFAEDCIDDHGNRTTGKMFCFPKF